ncbi:MAG: hypothetical protein ACI865_000876 [Flavobacteriaceae bacterium]
MELFDFIFRLGVVFAIYGFIWGIFDLGLRMLTGTRPRSTVEIYLIKAVKYFFLVDVTFLFCFENKDLKMIVLSQVIVAGLVLLTYFMGKLKNSQNKSAIFQVMRGKGLPQMPQAGFNMKAEVVLIVASLAFFAFFWFEPTFAVNGISRWFHESILKIEDTPLIGFIFKVIGFFFLMSLIFKMINAVMFLLSGGKVKPGGRGPNQGIDQENQSNGDDEFVDYEEVD